MMVHGVARRIYFDTNIFLLAFEAPADVSWDLRSILKQLKRSPQQAVTSEITLAELMGKESPVLGWAQQSRLYIDLLVFSGLIDLRRASRDILLETGEYRRAARKSGRKISLPDAIHVVTAVRAGCRYIFTADKRFAAPDEIQVITLADGGIASIQELLDA